MAIMKSVNIHTCRQYKLPVRLSCYKDEQTNKTNWNRNNEWISAPSKKIYHEINIRNMVIISTQTSRLTNYLDIDTLKPAKKIMWRLCASDC